MPLFRYLLDFILFGYDHRLILDIADEMTRENETTATHSTYDRLFQIADELWEKLESGNLAIQKS